jgi:hypothetical protein
MRYYKNGNITATPQIEGVILPSHETILANGWFVYIDNPPPFDSSTQRLVRGEVIEGVVQYEVVALSEQEIQQRIESEAIALNEEFLTQKLKQQAISQLQTINDPQEALDNQAGFPLWSSFSNGHTFAIGIKVQDFEGTELKLWEVIQLHNKQSDWRPVIVPALFKKVLPEGAPLIWEVGIAVTVGEEYLYQPDGFTYRVIQSHTTQAGWTPPAVPALWQRV